MKRPQHPVSTKTREHRAILVDWVKKATHAMTNNTVLARVQAGQLTPAEWRIFAEQRYLAAIPFEDLLRAGIQEALEIRDPMLAQVLTNNLNDELGLVDGVQIEERAHHTWRKDFYLALGISETQLHSAAPLPGTNQYSTMLKRLIVEGDALMIAGAILALEGSIPTEFTFIKTGRDKTFPHLEPKDRLYIDDHILHDAASHYPDLLKALDRYIEDPDMARNIHTGIEDIQKAKQAFYSSLEQGYAQS